MSYLKESTRKLFNLCNDTFLTINRYLINNSDNEVVFYINDFELYTDFNKYCYINNETIDFNYDILLINKNPENIIKELLKINDKKEEKTINEDIFNLNYKMTIFTKKDIDYDKLFTKLIEKSNNNLSKFNQIPKSLLLSPKNICNIIINEIKKVNGNKEYKHYIDINYDKPFILMIKLYIKTYTLEFNLILDTYPYLPPTLEFIKPSIKDELYFALLNLNILQFENWMSSITIDYIINNLAKILEPIFEMYINETDDNKDELTTNIYKLAYLTKDETLITESRGLSSSSETIATESRGLSSTSETIAAEAESRGLSSSERLKLLKLYIDIPKITTSCESKYWKSGTGYSSSGGCSRWDINKYISQQELLNNKIIECLKQINNLLLIKNDYNINNNYLINYINKQLKGINVLELENNLILYNEIFKILDYLHSSLKDKIIQDNIKKLYDELNIIDMIDDDKKNIKLILYKYIKNYETIENIDTNTYCNIMKNLQFTNLYTIPNYHKFYNYVNDSIKFDNKTKMRIISELCSFKSVLPLNNDSTIWCLTSKINFNIFTFIISGPKDTPYENGLFEFHAYFPPYYPNLTPKVDLHTTGNGQFRFNPNLYADGKVCLSLLGTWDSENQSEKWNPKTSTFLQVMISIQSLILIEQPYFNEPSYEREQGTDFGKRKSREYNEKIYPNTIKYAMLDMIKNPPLGLEEIIKNHFKLKKEDIITTINKWHIELTESSSHSAACEMKKIIDEITELLNTI